MLVVSLLAACTPSDVDLGGVADVPDAGVEDSAAPAEDTREWIPDTEAPEEPDPTVTEEDAPAFDDSDLAGWLFTLDRIHEIAITLPDESVAALGAAPYTWAAGNITIDGEEMEQVGVRLRGKIGSFRSLAGKPKFKIAFNELVEDQRFYGLEELSLNNAVVDCSYLKEVVGYRLYGLMDVPTLRTAYARVTVNGADYGLYVMLETPNDRWIDRNFADGSGNLYDGKYVWRGGYDYTLLDFGDGVDSLFQLEEGADVGNADIAAVSTALLTYQDTDAFYAQLGNVLDWDAFHRLTAVDQLLGHADGYSMNTNNYRVYFDPADGKAEIVPWDLDYTFIYDYQWGLTWRAPRGNLTFACWRDPAYCGVAHRLAMGELVTRFEAVDWAAWLDELEALTYTATQDDPRRECAATDVQPTRDYVRSWLLNAPTEMRAFWNL